MDEKIWRVLLKTGAVVELFQPFPHAKGAVSRVDANVSRLIWQPASDEVGRPAGIQVIGDLSRNVVMRDGDGKPVVQVDENTKKPLLVKDPESHGYAGICGPGFRPLWAMKESAQYRGKKLAMMFLPAGENGVIDYWESMVDLPQGLGPDATWEQMQAKLAEDIEAQIAAQRAEAGEDPEDDDEEEEDDEPDTLLVDTLALLGSLIEGGKAEPDQTGVDKALALIELTEKTIDKKREVEEAAEEAAALAEEAKEKAAEEAAEKAEEAAEKKAEEAAA